MDPDFPVGAWITITPEPDAYECPLCGGCHPFESQVWGVNGDMIDATDECGDVDCFPREWCAPGRMPAAKEPPPSPAPSPTSPPEPA